MRHLRSTIQVAQEVGESLESGAILLGALQTQREGLLK